MFSSFSQISLSFLQLSRSIKLFHSSSNKENVHEISHTGITNQTTKRYLGRFYISLTWIDLLQVIYDGDTIFIFHLKVSFRIDSLFTVVWSHNAVDNPKKFISWSALEQTVFHYILDTCNIQFLVKDLFLKKNQKVILLEMLKG